MRSSKPSAVMDMLCRLQKPSRCYRLSLVKILWGEHISK